MNFNSLKKLFIFSLIVFTYSLFFGQEFQPIEIPLHPDPWSLTIYRPENSSEMNEIRCYIKITDAETGEDVTYKKVKANYAWISTPHIGHNYKKKYFLSGGMCMHLLLKPGKYNISVYTPKDKVFGITTSNKGDWISNSFEYNTENPANVIWVIPTANKNGFYNGGWHITWKAPSYYKFVKPLVTED